MSCFKLSKFQCQKITSAMSSFWWNACDKKTKIHWVSWKNMCKSKDNGGIGFRDIGDFNQALLAKQAWKVLNEPDALLSLLYKERYFSAKGFLDCGKGYRPSYAWRSIIFGRDLLKRGLLKSVGNGETTWVWLEKWILDNNPRVPCNLQPSIDLNLRVGNLITSDGRWDITLLNDLFPPEDVKRILEMTHGNVNDRYIWAYNANGSYSVKSGYWFISNNPSIPITSRSPLELQSLELKRRLWKLQTVPKIKLFLWRVISGALSVAVRLQTRGMNVNSGCKLCNGASETISHVLFECPMALSLFQVAHIPAPPNGFSSQLELNVRYMFDIMEKQSIPEDARLAIPWFLWAIWKNRNSILYSGVQEALEKVIERAMEEAKLWRLVNQENNTHSLVNTRIHGYNGKWQPPLQGTIKCNIHSHWRNAKLHCGGAWIARDTDKQTKKSKQRAKTADQRETNKTVKTKTNLDLQMKASSWPEFFWFRDTTNV